VFGGFHYAAFVCIYVAYLHLFIPQHPFLSLFPFLQRLIFVVTKYTLEKSKLK
jgi:hypothetical protein